MIEMRLLFLIGVVVWQATGSNAVIPLNRVINGVNAFSNNIVKTIAEDVSGNFVCSPVNAGMVLAMATFGARGNTEKVLRSALALTDDNAVTMHGYQSLHDILTDSRGFELHLANTIFLPKGIQPTNAFREAVESAFRSRPDKVDFSRPADASKIINFWMAAQTENHSQDIVKETDFSSATSIVLVNDISFKTNWDEEFNKYHTKPRAFHVNGKDVKNVTTMWNYSIYKYGVLPEVKARFLELSYKDENSIDDASMIIILPDEIDGISELVKNLEKVSVPKLLSGTSHAVKLYLPKFKIESTIDLQVPLTKLGLGEIFTDGADFTGIVASPPMKVSKIVQKAVIEVNEKGTKDTSDPWMRSIYRMWDEDKDKVPVDFNVDHPFVAVIATKRGVPVLSSVVMEPIY